MEGKSRGRHVCALGQAPAGPRLGDASSPRHLLRVSFHLFSGKGHQRTAVLILSLNLTFHHLFLFWRFLL